MKSKFAQVALLGSMVLGLTSCGGIQEEAKVATALQTMMVLSIEAAIRYNIDNISSGTTLACSEGGSYVPSAGTDLTALINYVQNGGAAPTIVGAFDFANCKIDLCGETITLSGKAKFTVDGAIGAGSDRVLTIGLTSGTGNQITSAGIIEGAPQFDYDMNVEVSGNSLKGITITDGTKALEYNGKVYKAIKINDLARGC